MKTKSSLRQWIAIVLVILLSIGNLQALASEAEAQEDPIRILMVGNSLTRYNSVADKLERLFAYAGKQAMIDTRTQMGASLIDQAEILAASTREAIVEGDYDYIVLQEKSSGFTEALLRQGVQAFDPWIQEAESNPQLVLYMPWSNEDVFKSMQSTFTNAYVAVAKDYSALVAPSGEAYYDLYFNEGKHWYRNGDNVHGNDLASLVSASTLFYTIAGAEQPVLQIREEDQSVVRALVESSDYRNYPVPYDRDLVNAIERKAHAFATAYRNLDQVPDVTGRGVDATVNLAHQKQGSASSNARGATRGIGPRNVGNLTDGSYTSFIVLHEEDPNPWFGVDLGTPTAFNQLTLYWGATGDYADSFKAKFTVEGTNDPEAGYEVIATGESTSTAKQEIRFAAVDYQYVRVHVTEKKSDYASLYELEVYHLPNPEDNEEPTAEIDVKAGDYVQVQVGDSVTNMSLYEQGIYEAEVAFPQGVKDYKVLSNGESIYRGAIVESNASQKVIIRLLATEGKVVTGQDVREDVNGNPVQQIKKVANWTGNFFNRTGIEEFKAFGGWDQASPLSTLDYLGGGIFARAFTYTVPEAAVSYDYKVNFDRTWNNGEIPGANRNVVFPASDRESDNFVLWVDSINGILFDSINDGRTVFKLQGEEDYSKPIGTAKVELSLRKDGDESLYTMVQTRKDAYMVTAFIEPGTYTWTDQIDSHEGTLGGSLTVEKDTAVTFAYRVSEENYGMLNTVDHPEDFSVDIETVPVQSIQVNGHDIITTKGGTLPLTAEVRPTDATNKSVIWSVENGTGSATIDESGLLTAVSNGNVTVVATAADGSGVVGTKLVTISGQTTSPTGPTNPPIHPGPVSPPVVDPEPSTPSQGDIVIDGDKAIVELGSGITSKSIAVEDLGGRTLQVRAEKAIVTVQAESLKQWLTAAGNPSGASLEISVAPVSASDLSNVSAAGGQARVAVVGGIYDITLKLKFNDEVIDIQRGNGGVELTLPYLDGVDEELLGIYYYNEGSKQWEYAGGRVDAGTTTMTVTLEHLSTYAVLEYAKSFADVPAGHWAARTLEVLAAKHIVNGTSDTHFTPNGSTTRAEFTSLLVRALGLTDAASSVPFADVPSGQWYAEEVAIAYEAGLITGVSETTFDPHADITREQMAILLVRAYENENGTITASEQAIADLEDGASISSWAIEGVNKAMTAGLLQGKGQGIFDPSANATRAETAQAILNLFHKLYDALE
ncbi:S-layer homology domain-containing protein [Paenibacillus daejeonensis]|uniref:S-layer homology domain-containing protein n=1 Tax=Paenibacillus daejeonensis TaxID=135193 RepID=UPI000371A1E1|nr:S-layer homology domain-containing protein [Paenibacillus daejeonensis]